MKLNKPTVWIEMETTGLAPSSEYIVYLDMLKVFPDGNQETFQRYFKPLKPASKEAIEASGITNEYLEQFAPFSESAQEIFDWLSNCDYAGYRVTKFELPFLQEEFYRSNLVLEIFNAKIIDPAAIEYTVNPRALNKLCEKFGIDQGLSKLQKQVHLLDKQLEAYNLPDNITELYSMTTVAQPIDSAGKFIKTKEGQVVITFGKHKNKTVQEIFDEDPKYFLWMASEDISKPFPVHTRKVAAGFFEAMQKKTAKERTYEAI